MQSQTTFLFCKISLRAGLCCCLLCSFYRICSCGLMLLLFAGAKITCCGLPVHPASATVQLLITCTPCALAQVR